MTRSVLIYFAHATGLCGPVWKPVATALREGLEARWWDFPGHGNGPALSPAVDWWDFGRFVLDQVKPGGVGVGHSMGGAALAIAEVEQPGTFAALILIEPVILPPPFEPADHPLTSIVLKRRRTFESRKEAAKNFAGKAPFNRWHPAALSGYVEGGLKEHEGRFVLACDPKDEAAIYRAASAHGIWDRLSEIEIPVLVMASDAGGESQLSGYARTIAERLPRGGFEHVAGTSHFLPMEQPELVARRIERLAVVAESDR